METQTLPPETVNAGSAPAPSAPQPTHPTLTPTAIAPSAPATVTTAVQTLPVSAPPSVAPPAVVPSINPMANGSLYTPELNQGLSMPPSYVYAIGTIDARFPSLSLEKEAMQAEQREGGQIPPPITDRQALFTLFTVYDANGPIQNPDPSGQTSIQYPRAVNPDTLYIARDMCWILTVENVDTYILQPRTAEELNKLIAGLSVPIKIPMVDVDVVIGFRGPIAPPELCNGLQLPIAIINQLYSFQLSELQAALQSCKPANMPDSTFNTLTNQVFQIMMQLADNVGNLDEHRAVNYLTVRYNQIYIFTFEQYNSQPPKSLLRVDAKISPLSSNGARRIIDVIFTYRDNTTDIKTDYYATVDVTGLFPFLVEQLQPYYERPV